MDITDIVSDERNAEGRNDGEAMADLTKCADRARCSPWPRDCHREEEKMEESRA